MEQLWYPKMACTKLSTVISGKTSKSPSVFELTLSVPEILEKLLFVTLIIPQTWNINNLKTTRAKSLNLHTITKLIKYSLKNISVKVVFNVTVFEILQFEGRLLLSPAQQRTESKRIKLSVKNQKNIWVLLKIPEKWLTFKLGRFSMEMLENSIFITSIIAQNWNINNFKTASAKSMNLNSIRKLIKYSLKNVA